MKSKKSNDKGLVYSTEFGRTCPECGKSIGSCSCRKAPAKVPSDGVVRISRQTKGRKGAGVSIVTGVPLDEQGLKKLAKQLKQKCGTGGTIKSGAIEIQGDHRDTLKNELIKMGYAVKLSGG
jgi:translation initiation factor 1